MKPLLWSLVVSAVVCSLCLFVTQWMGLADDWRIFVSVFLGVLLGNTLQPVVAACFPLNRFSGKR
ncbi:hypothetical protein [Phocaeicola barnesiae]|uniref:hypothetical protein n=1 Tax=Phocaeicola barnesiae TaxID=376804 RepID=UPI001E057EAD|nr:hypothetical protein [Phocaeicola barnesiae]HJG78169.1 hypothetical protein [Phocaeicola barnesiae]